MDKLELARLVYRLLADRCEGMSRGALTDALGVNDREMRDAVELCAKLAAQPTMPNGKPQVVGFDPQTQRYVMAQDVTQADRIIAFTESYVRSALERLEAYRAARAIRWGLQHNAEQEALF
jgi:hypothetical protein